MRTVYFISRGRVLRARLTSGARNEVGCGAEGTGGSTYHELQPGSFAPGVSTRVNRVNRAVVPFLFLQGAEAFAKFGL